MGGSSIPISPALARWAANAQQLAGNDALVAHGFLTGDIPTRAARQQPARPNIVSRMAARLVGRKWQRSPDREASLRRKRQLGGSSGLPAELRQAYTEGERACLAVIAGEVKHHGLCDLAVDRIAAIAGVSRTTCQNAVRKAKALGHVYVQERRRHGRKNLTNLIRIIASDWLQWIKRAPALARTIGFNLLHPTRNQDISSTGESRNRTGRAACEVAMGLGKGRMPGRSAGSTNMCGLS